MCDRLTTWNWTTLEETDSQLSEDIDLVAYGISLVHLGMSDGIVIMPTLFMKLWCWDLMGKFPVMCREYFCIEK